MEKFKITETWQSYSKRQGSITKRRLLVKNLTKEELDQYIATNFGKVTMYGQPDDRYFQHGTSLLGAKSYNINSQSIKKQKELRFWSGRGHGIYSRGTFFVAAYSAAEATRIIQEYGDCRLSPGEIRDYYGENEWGVEKNIEAPALYAKIKSQDKEMIKLF